MTASKYRSCTSCGYLDPSDADKCPNCDEPYGARAPSSHQELPSVKANKSAKELGLRLHKKFGALLAIKKDAGEIKKKCIQPMWVERRLCDLIDQLVEIQLQDMRENP